jgi:hypothetical protein
LRIFPAPALPNLRGSFFPMEASHELWPPDVEVAVRSPVSIYDLRFTIYDLVAIRDA